MILDLGPDFWVTWGDLEAGETFFENIGEGAECDVVVGCNLFSMHFSQSKNALLLDFNLY